jgi:putative ABC transport system ATP-binding protein
MQAMMDGDAAGPSQDIAVYCRGVTKTYGTGDARVMALRGIDFEVRRGELLLLVGPSGCGKTTLISIIAATLDQDSGKCEVLGHDLEEMDQRERAHFRGVSIGFVFQIFNLLPALTALENVTIPLLINGTPQNQAEARAREALEAVGLGTRLDARPAQLSGGQQQRVAIARALVNDPAILLADEPTGNLDSKSGAEIMQLLLKLNRERTTTLLIVTHDPEVAAQTQRIIHIRDGLVEER